VAAAAAQSSDRLASAVRRRLTTEFIGQASQGRWKHNRLADLCDKPATRSGRCAGHTLEGPGTGPQALERNVGAAALAQPVAPALGQAEGLNHAIKRQEGSLAAKVQDKITTQLAPTVVKSCCLWVPFNFVRAPWGGGSSPAARATAARAHTLSLARTHSTQDAE
jgi:hypothetical protein